MNFPFHSRKNIISIVSLVSSSLLNISEMSSGTIFNNLNSSLKGIVLHYGIIFYGTVW